MDYLPIIATLIFGLLVGAVITWLYLKQKMVDKAELDKINEQLSKEKLSVATLEERRIEINRSLEEQRVLNREQETDIRKNIEEISGLRSRYESLVSRYQEDHEINAKQNQELKSQSDRMNNMNQMIAQLKVTNHNLQEKLEKQDVEFEKRSKNLVEVFKNEAQKVFEEKSRNLSVQNQEGIENILKPLNEKIKSFQDRVESSHKESIDRHARLREQILGLKTLNEVLSQEAQNLTKALKGDSKIQGNWGEVILQRVLEQSGLEQGREYEIQQSFQTDEGRKQPDVVISFPDNKKYIIDSKVSLVAYENLVNATDESEQQIALRAHILSLSNHVKQLSEKKYHELYQMESPDLVLMFVPIETAFSVAINKNPQLYNDAFDKRIVIVTPSTLLATLKTIDTMWQNEKQRKNTIEIASEAGKMYDKLVAFLQDLNKIGDRMEQTKSEYSKAVNKLSTGRGNLINRAQKLKKLGAKANKQMDQLWLEESEED
jgi:DNA recombination protein RmuC